MSPAKLRADQYYTSDDTARIAAVLALINGPANNLSVTFIKRTTHPNDMHSGQISFPGGGKDPEDSNHIDCALRETEEEIGIARNNIHILGPLTPLFVYASNNMVYPYVGYHEGIPMFTPDRTEVAEIINVPLTYISRPEIVLTKELKIRGYTLPNVPYYDLYGHVLWGATAMMIAELISLWKEIEL